MPADIYKPELWNSFFVMVGGGVAALTGLVFVALSIALSLNLDEMTKDATHKYRSINTLAGLTAVFVTCGLVLMPGQNHKAIGTELALLALAGAATFLFGFRQAFKFGSGAEQTTSGDRNRYLCGRSNRSCDFVIRLSIRTLCGSSCHSRKRGLHDFSSMVAGCQCVQRKNEELEAKL
jgi:hypothetical protein